MVCAFPTWVVTIPFGLAGCLVVLAGVLQWKLRFPPLTLGCLGGAVFLAGLVGPTLANDRVVLDEERLEQTTGLWWSPTVKGFALVDVRRVVIAEGYTEVAGLQELWTVERTDGTTEVIDPGDLWEQNRDGLVSELRARGLDVLVVAPGVGPASD